MPLPDDYFVRVGISGREFRLGTYLSGDEALSVTQAEKDITKSCKIKFRVSHGGRFYTLKNVSGHK